MWPKALGRTANLSVDTPADIRAWTATKTSLRLEASAAFASQLQSLLRQSSVEVSGILLGRRLDSRVILLRSLQIVEDDWQHALEVRHRPADQVLGFFRIRQGQGLEFTVDDQDVANTLFTSTDHVFLIIRNQGTAIAAGVYWREGDEIHGELAYPLWPAPIPVNNPLPAPAPRASLMPQLPPQPAASSNRILIAFLSVVALIGLLAIATLAGIEILRRLPRWPASEPAVAVERRPLSLDVRLEGGRMLITWDTNAPTIRSAESGSLRITDGASDRTIVMDAADLMVGRVAYLPAAERVQLQLDVRTKTNGLVSEVIRVLHASAPPVVPQVRSAVQPQPVVERVKTPPPPAAVAQRPAAPPAVAERAELKQTTNTGEELQELVIPPQPTNLGLLTQVTPITPANPGAPAAAPPPLPSAPPVRQPQPKPAPQQQPTPPPQQQQPSPPPPVALNPTPAVATFKAPPYVSPALQKYLQKEETVSVEVTINAQGIVERAHALPGSFKVLEPTAEMAARKWRFQPATIRGRAVPSSTVLQFVFKKK